jgi:hypothetical protein
MPNYKGNEATLKKYQPKWRTGATQTIRVPVALADQILSYAHQLDEGLTESNSPASLDNESLTQVIEWLEDVKQTKKNNFNNSKKGLIQKAIDKLRSTVTSDLSVN